MDRGVSLAGYTVHGFARIWHDSNWARMHALKIQQEEYNQLKTWAKDVNGHLTKEGNKTANKNTERSSESYVSREMQIKAMR